MKLFILIIVFVAHFKTVSASTFVGNGGNVGDVELQVALRQLTDVSAQLLEEKGLSEDLESLCTCPKDLQSHPMCEPLINLNTKKEEFCRQFLKSKIANLNLLLKSKASLEIRWTNENIDVRDQNYLRAADAVMNWQNKVLIINQNRFVRFKQSERVFLIAHEMMHLIDDENGNKLQDSGEIGPFIGESGGREFINAMAAALTVKTIDEGILNNYFETLNRSRSSADIWFDLSLGSLSLNPSQSSTFAHNYLAQYQLGLRYQFSAKWGLGIQHRQNSGGTFKVKGVSSSEVLEAYQLGVNYRIFPSTDILSTSGQSHFVLGAYAEYMKGHLSLSDTYLRLDDDTSSLGLVLNGRYYLASQSGWWGFMGLSLLSQKYKYKFTLDDYSLPNYEVLYPNQQYLWELGVSYGF